MVKKKKKNAFNTTVFPGGPPPQYDPGPNWLDFADRTRCGIFQLVWSNAFVEVAVSVYDIKSFRSPTLCFPAASGPCGVIQRRGGPKVEGASSEEGQGLACDFGSFFSFFFLVLFFICLGLPWTRFQLLLHRLHTTPAPITSVYSSLDPSAELPQNARALTPRGQKGAASPLASSGPGPFQANPQILSLGL